MTNIPITKGVFGPEEFAAIQKPLETGWLVQGPYVREFEDKFCQFSGAPHSIATTSCTTALHIAVAALGLKPGDEVIVPSFTWIATANAIEYLGAKPVFCDIDLTTFNLDVSQVESLITSRTVGLLPVHLFGLCAEMDTIRKIADKHHLWIVEDAACAFGAWYRGRHAGTMSDAGCFSFHPRKSITTGEGGMITTARPDLDKLARSLRDHGASKSDLARHQGKTAFLLSEFNLLGYNFRMTDIQGALGSAQMDRAHSILAARANGARRYDQLLKGIDWLVPPVVPEGCVHGYQSYVCLFHPESAKLDNVERLYDRRNDLLTKMEAKGIATRQGTHAPVMLGYYAQKYGLEAEQYPQALMADHLTITLPLYAQMTEDDQIRVAEALKAEGP
jgi:perosamine synthetase